MKRRIQQLLRGAAAITAALVVLGGCSKPEVAAGRINAFTEPHVLRWANATDVNTLNPHLGQILTLSRLSELTMAWLVKFDAHNRPYPELATVVPTQANGGVSRDGLTITYHLRRGVKWSDGTPFNADDVVFSTKAVLNPRNNEVSRQGWDLIRAIDEPDKYTVVYHLRKPYSPFIEVFFATAGANPCVIPAHILAKLPDINKADYNALPVGIGPFKYDRWDRGQQIVLVPNALYFRGMPKLQKIIFKVIPDRNTLLAQFQAHDVDLWDAVSGSYATRLEQLPAYRLEQTPGYQWNHLDFVTTNPALRDPTVRRAILLATDRTSILQKIFHGFGIVNDSVTPPTAPYAVTVPTTAYDPAKAKTLLENDGWKAGSDGVRVKDGARLSFRYATYSGYPDIDNEIELLRSEWKAIGVEISVRHYPVAQFFAPRPDGIMYSDKYDITSFTWTSEALGDYSPTYGCDALPPAGQNVARWKNAAACAAMADFYAHYDESPRNRDVSVVARALATDVPAPVVFHRMDLYAENRDLRGFRPNAVSPFDDFMQVDI